MAEIVSKTPDAQVMADLDGALKWAARGESFAQTFAFEHRAYPLERMAAVARAMASSNCSTHSCSSVRVPDAPPSSASQLSGAVAPMARPRAATPSTATASSARPAATAGSAAVRASAAWR